MHGGFRYQKNKTKGAKIYWRCWRKTCNVFIQTAAFDLDEDNPRINILNAPVHNHRDEGDVISTTTVVQRMIRAIEADPTKPVKRVYDEVVRQAANGEGIPQFDSVRSQLNRRRAALRPPNTDRVDRPTLCVEHEWSKTWSG